MLRLAIKPKAAPVPARRYPISGYFGVGCNLPNNNSSESGLLFFRILETFFFSREKEVNSYPCFLGSGQKAIVRE